MEVFIVKFTTGTDQDFCREQDKIFSYKEAAEEYVNRRNMDLMMDGLHYDNYGYFDEIHPSFTFTDKVRFCLDKYERNINFGGASYEMTGPFTIE